MFTQPAFIRKNTPELRKKLEELGYKVTIDARHQLGVGLRTYFTDDTGYVLSMPSGGDSAYKGIDCGTNEELFLALAALRDDSNYNQWFTDGCGCWFKMEPLSTYTFL